MQRKLPIQASHTPLAATERRFVFYHPRALVGDGGATKTVWEWCGALADEGWRVAVAIDPSLGGEARLPSVEVLPVPHRGAGRARVPVSFGRLLRASDVVSLQSCFAPHNYVAAIAVTRARGTWIIMPQGALAPNCLERRAWRKRAVQPLERVLLNRAVGVHVCFEPEKDYVHRVAPRAGVIVAPTAFDVSSPTWEPGGEYLAWFGRYDVEQKGLDLLFSAVARTPVADRMPLRLHGRASKATADQVQALASDAGVSGWVDVMGPVEGSRARDAFLLDSRAFVQPSRWESNSVALLEALALGVPSLVTTTNPIHQLLSSEGAAVVVEPTATEIARGLQRVVHDSDELSRNTTEVIEKHLCWPEVVPRFIEQLDVFANQRATGLN